MEKQQLPNATISLVLGILSILLCWCYLIPSLLLGTIAIILANKDRKTYLQDPQLYSNYGNAQAGKIMGIIGIVMAVLFILVILYVFKQAGITLEDLRDEAALREKLENLQNQ